MPRHGLFIMIDGIAGSGKSTLLHVAKEQERAKGRRVFDLREWTKTHADPPNFTDVSDHNVFFTYEPTRQWIGAAIRFELSRTDHPYSGESLAHAFALDREIMYTRLIIPALRAGMTVIQDRGVCTSIVYQPIMTGGIQLEDLLKLPGNALAMQYSPDHLILTKLSPEIAVERLKQRDEESKGVFANLDFLRKVDERFRSDWFKELFTSKGTTIHSLSTAGSLDESISHSKQLLSKILNLES